ncbi:MAG: ATP-grasp domain-containing protein [Candidatus Bathyarchaeia archaeon]
MLKVGVMFNFPMKPQRGEDIDYLAETEVMDQVNAVQNALRSLGIDYILLPIKDDLEDVIRAIKEYKPSAIINLAEGYMGDSSFEMHIPSILEILGIPYTGSTPITLGLCKDKHLAKAILRANKMPTPKYSVMEKFKKVRGLKFPLIVKPLREDASIGITRQSFVRSLIDLERQVNYVNNVYRQPALVEEYISGREFNVSILGNEEPLILPISEIVFEFDEDPKIVDYAAKWIKESDGYAKTKPVCPAELSEELKYRIEEVALKAYRALGCRDYARIDIRLEDKTGIPYVLDVNPNPDISLEAGFTRSLRAAGISYENFIMKIISFALSRAGKAPSEL